MVGWVGGVVAIGKIQEITAWLADMDVLYICTQYASRFNSGVFIKCMDPCLPATHVRTNVHKFLKYICVPIEAACVVPSFSLSVTV